MPPDPISRPFGDPKAVSLVVLIAESKHTACAAHCTLYSVRRKGLRSLMPFIFTLLLRRRRRRRSSDNSPHMTRVRLRYPRFAYSAPSWIHSHVRAQCEVGEARAIGIGGTRER